MSGACLPERVTASALVLLYQQLRQYLYFCTRVLGELERSIAMRSCMRQYLYLCTVLRLYQRMCQYLYCGTRQPEELERSDALLHAAFHVGCEAHKDGGVKERLTQRVRDAVDRLDEVGEDDALAGALAHRARAAARRGAALQSLRGAVPDATRDDAAPPRLRAAECVSICTFVLVNEKKRCSTTPARRRIRQYLYFCTTKCVRHSSPH